MILSAVGSVFGETVPSSGEVVEYNHRTLLVLLMSTNILRPEFVSLCLFGHRHQEKQGPRCFLSFLVARSNMAPQRKGEPLSCDYKWIIGGFLV